MKKALLALLFIPLLFVGCGHKFPTVSPVTSDAFVADKAMEASVIRITGVLPGSATDLYICTGFSIGGHKFMTAAHCTPDKVETWQGESLDYQLMADSHKAFLLKKDEAMDLAVIMADIDKPSVTFRDEPLEWLESVDAMGFGHGFRFPLVTSNRVQKLKTNMGYDAIYPGTVFMSPFIGGMSGGPVYDLSGKVVGVVQRGGEYIGYGVDIDTIHQFLNAHE